MYFLQTIGEIHLLRFFDKQALLRTSDWEFQRKLFALYGKLGGFFMQICMAMQKQSN